MLQSRMKLSHLPLAQRQRLRILAIAIAVVLSANAAKALGMCSTLAVPQTVDSAILAEQSWTDALQQHDPDQLNCLLAPGFKQRRSNGEERTRVALLASIAKEPAVRIVQSNLSAALSEDTATVRGINTITDAAGKTVRVRFTDVFVYSHYNWKPLSSEETLAP